jgi:hypothetical protein
VSPDVRLVQRAGVETRPYKEGAMLVDMGTGQCYRLNRVGAEIWTLLQQPRALPELCDELGRKYPRSREELERDVRALVEHLVSETLLQPQERAP